MPSEVRRDLRGGGFQGGLGLESVVAFAERDPGGFAALAREAGYDLAATLVAVSALLQVLLGVARPELANPEAEAREAEKRQFVAWTAQARTKHL